MRLAWSVVTGTAGKIQFEHIRKEAGSSALDDNQSFRVDKKVTNKKRPSLGLVLNRLEQTSLALADT